MKRAAAIILLSVFAFNFAGVFFIFKIQQFHIRQEIKQQIKQGVPEKELTLITVTPENESQLEWEHKNEFQYKGAMYDVVKKEIVNKSKVIYHCITDSQETILFAILEEEEEGKKYRDAKNDGTQPVKNVLLLLSNLYFQPQKIDWTLFQNDTTINYGYFYHYSSPALDITSPPPKIV